MQEEGSALRRMLSLCDSTPTDVALPRLSRGGGGAPDAVMELPGGD